ncbi:MAG: reactive intermediate/imine deaminase [Deltaproteobacteria bacterium]|nr:reactive intermediate/imine deaminase [Deltaproteobacteria bacterium]
MKRKIIQTKDAPAAIGPYSQGTVLGNLVFTAGQIPLDPESGKLVEGDITEQAGRALGNLKAVLNEAGSGIERVLRLDVYMTDLRRFSTVNEFFQGVFPENPPARVTVEVAGLPMGAEIEIAAIAAISR